jgi:hypothetical protein
MARSDFMFIQPPIRCAFSAALGAIAIFKDRAASAPSRAESDDGPWVGSSGHVIVE